MPPDDFDDTETATRPVVDASPATLIGNADRRSTWFARAHSVPQGKGARRPNPATIPIPAQSPTGAAWVPAGPSTVRNGQAIGGPTVSGRVLDIAVGPGGTRAYAATADGGVWRYTEDRSTTPATVEWVPLHDGARSPDATTQAANALATGAIAVRWGVDAGADRLFIATGEIHPGTPSTPATTPWVAGGYPGIGVRVSTGNPGPAGVTQEALNLDGHGCRRLIIDPDDPNVVWAATDIGLFQRPASGSPATWTQVTHASFPATSSFVTDIAITGSGANKVVWAAFWHRGVWRRSGSPGVWAQVPGLPAPTNTAPGNMTLAAAPEPANATAVYVLDSLGNLYRFDGTRFQLVTNTPPNVVNGQGWYDLALAVRPGSPNQVVIGGDTLRSPATAQSDRSWEAMLFSSTLTVAAPTWNFGFVAANSARNSHGADATFIGGGVHADVQRVAFGQLANGNPDPSDVWVACDGGVFRSTSGPTNGAFRSLNVGLASVQLNHVASHPTAESVMLGGSQDNGVMRSSGDQTWFESPKGDGGGVVIDPSNPTRMAAQYTRASINATLTGGIGGGEWRSISVPISNLTDVNGRLREQAAFYAPLRTAPAGTAPMLLAHPTHRVWVSPDWGQNWFTLPGGNQPANAQLNVDSLTGATRRRIVDLSVSSATRVHAATGRTVYRINRTAAPTGALPVGTWSAAVPLTRVGLPPVATRPITALGVASANAPESLYVGLGGTGTAQDHVFWFDAAANVWRPTGLATAGFGAPVGALTVDPTDSNVYVGSPVGVWRGVPSGSGAGTTWAWTNISMQLPEATVLDIEIAVFGTGAGAQRILRVATFGRGAWELVLGRAASPDPEVHLRMNNAESGRRHASMRGVADPQRMPGATTTWLDSPDLRLRRPSLPVSPNPDVPATPGVTAPPAFSNPLQRRTLDTQMWNGAIRRPVRFLQRNIVRRGVSIGIDGDFGGGTQTAVQTLQRRYEIGRHPSGIVDARTWLAITSVPDLGTGLIDARQFGEDIRPDIDEGTGAMIADATGSNTLYVQLHARGSTLQPRAGIRVALLLAPLTGTPLTGPTLPNGWSARIRANDTGWASNGWVLAGGANPYRSPPGDLSDRGPEIVSWTIDFSALGFAAGTEVVALVATHLPSQPLTVASRNPQTVVETTPAVAARRVRLDAVTPIPAP